MQKTNQGIKIKLEKKVNRKNSKEKCQHQDESAQKIILEKSIRQHKIKPQIELDKIIEIIYAVAAELRLAGKQERNFEREWGMTLAEVLKSMPATGINKKV